jgi:hypothetical protein
VGRRRTWTDDQLRAAVAASTSFTEVLRRLGLSKGGGSFQTVRTRAELLDLDTEHFHPHATRTRERARKEERDRRRWTDQGLDDAVAAADSLKGVFDHLGLQVGGSQWQALRQLILARGLDTKHWKRPLGSSAGRSRPWTDDDLRRVVPGSRSYAEVLRRLEVRPGGSNHAAVRDRIAGLGLDVSHMVGRGWNRGLLKPAGGVRPRPLDEILVADSAVTNVRLLKRRLVEEGLLEPLCARCRIETWLGRPMPLELDHINGDRRDNRLENLRFLCPNCHALTDTYRGRNIGRYDAGPAS